MVANISTHFVQRSYAPVDAADKVSCRPDFAVAIYPGHLLEHTSKKAQLNAALKEAGVPVEMHLYAQGGHAFGLRRTKYPVTEWPQLVETWLRTIGMVSP